MWNIGYHEQELIKEGKKRASAVALMARCNCEFTLEEARKFYSDECNESEDELTTGDELLKFYIGQLGSGGEHHEWQLRKAHEQFATAKIIIERGKYTEISFDEIQAEVNERLK